MIEPLGPMTQSDVMRVGILVGADQIEGLQVLADSSLARVVC